MGIIEKNKNIQSVIENLLPITRDYITLSEFVRSSNNGCFNKNDYANLLEACKSGTIWNSKKISKGWAIYRVTGFKWKQAISIKGFAIKYDIPLYRLYSGIKRNYLKKYGQRHSYFLIESEAVKTLKDFIEHIPGKNRVWKFLILDMEEVRTFLKGWDSKTTRTASSIFEECGVPYGIIYHAITSNLLEYENQVGVVYHLRKKPFIAWLNTRLEKPIVT